MRRRASEPIKSMLTLSSLYYLNSDRKSKINDQMVIIFKINYEIIIRYHFYLY